MPATPPPATPSEPDTTPEDYRQRALLLADLGRYDEAAEEIAVGLEAAPADAALLATLARVHLAADQPAEALVAAERAVAAAPGTLNPLVVRGMALADSRRYSDAAQVATGILRNWPDDPYAQRTGAALLSEARNGQEALNAAWQAVRVAPDEAEAHLVLSVVAARLRLFDLAQRAYAEALELDAAIGDAQRDAGVVRLERRRWAHSLEELADDAVLDLPPTATAPGAYPSPFPRPYRRPQPADTAAMSDEDEDADPRSGHPRAGGPRSGGPRHDHPRRDHPRRRASDRNGGWFDPSVPSGLVLDVSGDSAHAVRQAVLYAATGTLTTATLAAVMTLASMGASRVWAGMIGVLVFVAVLVWLSRRLLEPTGLVLARLRGTDRRLAFAAYASFVAPLVIVAYAIFGGFLALIAAMTVAAIAELTVLAHRS
jgi:Flp pilus assembly protein TadD